VARHSEKGDGSKDQLQLLRERVRELERDNERLKNSEERFQALFEHAPDAYYLSDLKGTFVDGNAAAEAVTGYKREELIGRNFLALKLLSSEDLRTAASLLGRISGHRPGRAVPLSRDEALVQWRSRPPRGSAIAASCRDRATSPPESGQANSGRERTAGLYRLAEIAERKTRR
jgi:PAS domain S-box-containing protein